MKIKQIPWLALCLTITACGPEQTAETKPESYEVISPIVKNTPYTSEYVAEIQSVRYVEVRSKIKGFIEKNYVDEGQTVKKGQLLFSLSFMEHEKELQKANADYKAAIADLKASEVELGNVKRLVEKNIVSKTELEVLEAKINALKAKVEEAQANKEQVALHLDFSQIKAPYDGIINRIPHKVGSLIEEGDMLTSISDNSEIFAYFHLSEVDYLNYISGNEEEMKVVSLRLANNELYPYKGKIEMIESEFDRETGNIAFRARFPNSDGILKHGANGKIVINKTLKQALVIPQKSTFEVQDQLYVFVVDKNNVLHQRNIVPKMRFTDYYAIESGLTKDDRIVFEGVDSAKDGENIEPKFVDLAASMSEVRQ
ncbi:efflux RND transporter periplasmic adaptor subunit [Methylomonas sp. SURF-2]|uniref:Efflux RND transporter periplasmic adaptor subunit n=1 Tax=Methylomonas subterranea TaxID=2952225 RepID=A0ABT1TD98_9GAMM|nr:efflux RND transporter periplasmic adaptor subunit [Methylomonas sp. SURF-2]MCQ8103435.1 efflux RND transporter periplasmic adaptor subunit [Methylomonas sp. SURF-2]